MEKRQLYTEGGTTHKTTQKQGIHKIENKHKKNIKKRKSKEKDNSRLLLPWQQLWTSKLFTHSLNFLSNCLNNSKRGECRIYVRFILLPPCIILLPPCIILLPPCIILLPPVLFYYHSVLFYYHPVSKAVSFKGVYFCLIYHG